MILSRVTTIAPTQQRNRGMTQQLFLVSVGLLIITAIVAYADKLVFACGTFCCFVLARWLFRRRSKSCALSAGASACTSTKYPWSQSSDISAGVLATGAPLFWKQGITGSGCRVAVIDTGVDVKHADLASKVEFGNDYRSVLTWLETLLFSFDPHGTRVAGIISANGKLVGVAPGATIIDYRLLESDETKSMANTSRPYLAKAITDAVIAKCDVINFSGELPSPTENEDRTLKEACNNAVAAGVLIVAAAGNANNNNRVYPAGYHNVFSVGAVDVRLSNKDIVWKYGGPKVNATADGECELCVSAGGGHDNDSGSSIAAPHISGLAALLHQQYKYTGKELFSALIHLAKRQINLDHAKYGHGVCTAWSSIGKMLNSSNELETLKTREHDELRTLETKEHIFHLATKIVEVKPHISSINPLSGFPAGVAGDTIAICTYDRAPAVLKKSKDDGKVTLYVQRPIASLCTAYQADLTAPNITLYYEISQDTDFAAMMATAYKKIDAFSDIFDHLCILLLSNCDSLLYANRSLPSSFIELPPVSAPLLPVVVSKPSASPVLLPQPTEVPAPVSAPLLPVVVNKPSASAPPVLPSQPTVVPGTHNMRGSGRFSGDRTKPMGGGNRR